MGSCTQPWASPSPGAVFNPSHVLSPHKQPKHVTIDKTSSGGEGLRMPLTQECWILMTPHPLQLPPLLKLDCSSGRGWLCPWPTAASSATQAVTLTDTWTLGLAQSKTTRAIFFFFKCSSFPTLPATALVQRFGGQGKEGRHMGKKKGKKQPSQLHKAFS